MLRTSLWGSLALLLAFGSSAQAQTDFNWLTAVNGNWSDTLRWNPVGSPGQISVLDTATIAAGGAANYVVTLDASRQIEALTIDDVFARLTTGANVLTVNGLAHIKNGELGGGTNISGGLFSVLRNSAKIRTTSASTIATATLENEAGANLEVSGATLSVNSATVTNAGTIDIRGGNSQAATLNLNNGATNTGTINLTNAGPAGSTVSLNAAGGVIDNQGAINVEVGTGGGTRNLGADLANSGTVNINANTNYTKVVGTITNTGSFNTAATRSFSMTSGNQTFEQTGGTLANNGSFNMTGGTFDFTGGALTGNAIDLTNSLLNIGNAAGSGVINLRGTGSTFTGGISAGQTVNILGGNAANATTTAANGFTNDGTINLTNQGPNGSTVTLNVTNGALTNNGTLNSVVGIGGGARNLGADVQNNGTVNIDTNTNYTKASGTITNAGDFNIAATRSLSMTSGNQTFTQSAGSFDNLGSFALTSGNFNFNGGTMSGNAPVLTNSTLAIGPGTGAATFDMRGTGSSLTTNVLANQVVNILGGNAANATLTSANDFTNAGTINLTNSGPNGSNVSLNGTNLVNSGTLNSEVGTGGGGRNIGLNLTNNGTVNIDATTTFTAVNGQILNNGDFNTSAGRQFNMTSGNQIFNQNGGTLDNLGALNITNGTFNLNGGTLSGNAISLTNSDLNLGHINPGTSNAVFHLNGTGNEMTGTVNAGETVEIRGGNAANATVTAATSFTNNGLIRLTNTGPNGSVVSLGINANPGTLTNAGTLEVLQGNGGSVRNLTLNLQNTGTTQITAASTNFNRPSSTVTNTGDFTVESGAGVNMTAGNQVFNQNAGTLEVDGSFSANSTTFHYNGGTFGLGGSFNLTNGTFNHNGGAILGNAVGLSNSDLNLGAGSGAAIFHVTGTNNDLTGNVSAAQEISIRGGNAANATLNSASGLTNAGTIEMTNIGPNPSTLALNVNGLLDNQGTLRVFTGNGGGGRNISGNLSNSGTVQLGASTNFNLANSTVTNTGNFTVEPGTTTSLTSGGQTFQQNGGTLDIDGTLQVTNGTFQYNGGSITGNAVSLNNSALAIAPGTGAAAFDIRGIGNTFSGTVNAGQELSIIGGNAAAATLTAANGFTNAGTIEMTNTGPNGSTLTINVNSGSLLNQGELVVLSGIGGGARALNVTLENAAGGTVFIGQNTTLGRAGSVHTNAGEMTLDANLTVAGGSTSFTNLASGLIEGDATLNVSALAGGLLNQGTISPGLSPGILTVQGNYSESATALLAIELGGTTVGTTFDRLSITGNASLAGLLQVTLINGFVPTSSDVFTILTAGTRTGAFANALAQLVTGFGVFDVVYAGNSVSLTNFQPLNVVPEPSTILLAVIGAGAYAIARARRRRA